MYTRLKDYLKENNNTESRKILLDNKGIVLKNLEKYYPDFIFVFIDDSSIIECYKKETPNDTYFKFDILVQQKPKLDDIINIAYQEVLKL